MANKPYQEDDITNPQGIYGVTKLKGEVAIKRSGCKHIIIRTAWVFSEYGNNFLKTMLRLSAENSSLRIVGDQVGCPTYAQDLSKAIIIILESFKSKEFTSCLYHFSGDLPCSWAEFSRIIFEEALKLSIISYKPNVVSITTKEFPTLAVRPAQSMLNSNKIKINFGIDASNCILGIRSSLAVIKINSIRE